MKFSTLALLSAVALNSTTANPLAMERVDFSGDISSSIVGQSTVNLNLEGSYCDIQFETLPFIADCHVGMNLIVDDASVLSASADVGAKFVLQGEDELRLIVDYGVALPTLEHDGGLNLDFEVVEKKFPAEGGHVEIDIENYEINRTCVSDVVAADPEGSAALNTIAGLSGSDVCVDVSKITKDKADGVSFKILAHVEIFNEDLEQVPLINAAQFAEIRDALGLPEISVDIDVGKKLVEHLNKENAVTERRVLRRLAEGSSNHAYIGEDGTFKMGSKAKAEGADHGLLFAGVAASGALLIGVGAAVAMKKRSSRV